MRGADVRCVAFGEQFGQAAFGWRELEDFSELLCAQPIIQQGDQCQRFLEHPVELGLGTDWRDQQFAARAIGQVQPAGPLWPQAVRIKAGSALAESRACRRFCRSLSMKAGSVWLRSAAGLQNSTVLRLFTSHSGISL
ncbi:hypothetical protein [Azomonas macrocytogenes]|uniref:Uncharacterized protein n=1 Tax=Azomonas macrocytogenes TaxID=69962 RepID=A0A839T633_AZOMA|nr:hypothetical protein [Azomonas macrocytogenes]MBB3103143.1 hypothetical protein [Azomonas macrocytogenes]